MSQSLNTGIRTASRYYVAQLIVTAICLEFMVRTDAPPLGRLADRTGELQRIVVAYYSLRTAAQSRLKLCQTPVNIGGVRGVLTGMVAQFY